MDILFLAFLVSPVARSGHVIQCWPRRPKQKTGGKKVGREFFAFSIKGKT